MSATSSPGLRRAVIVSIALAAALVLVFGFSASAFAVDTVITVSPDSPNGWRGIDENAVGGEVVLGTGTFVVGPGTPPAGTGSAQMQVTGDLKGYGFRAPIHAGLQLSTITELEYSVYRVAPEVPYWPTFFLSVDTDGPNVGAHGWQGRLVFAPPSVAAGGAWATFDLLTEAGWFVSNGGVAALTGCPHVTSSGATGCTWTQLLANIPGATVQSNGLEQVGFKLGAGYPDPSTSFVDKLVIDTGADSVTYDFETQCSVNCAPEISLNQGWNLVSLPVDLGANVEIDDALASIAGKYSTVHAYDGCAATPAWLSSYVGMSGATLLNHSASAGYWVFVTAPDAVLIPVGSAFATSSVPLCEGWNVVSYPFSTPRLVADAVAGCEAAVNIVWGVDGAGNWISYDPLLLTNDLDALSPGEGYYINALADCTLQFAAQD